MRVNPSAINSQFSDIHPLFERMASRRALEAQGIGFRADVLVPALRPETLLELGSVYRGGDESIADFVTDQALSVGRLCADAETTGTLHPRLLNLLTQTELARRWLIGQPDITPPSAATEARRTASWTAQIERYFVRARALGFREMVSPGLPPGSAFIQSLARVGGIKSSDAGGPNIAALPQASAVGAATLSAAGSSIGSAMLASQRAGISAAMEAAHGPTPVERRASSYDLGVIKEKLAVIKRRKPGWIEIGSEAQRLYSKSTNLLAAVIGDIWAIARLPQASRPAANAVSGCTQGVQSFIRQIDESYSLDTLETSVRGLEDISGRLKTIMNASIIPYA